MVESLFAGRGGQAITLQSSSDLSRLAGPLSVDWFNHPRLHGEIPDDAGYTTPAAFEADHYSQNPAALEAVTQ